MPTKFELIQDQALERREEIHLSQRPGLFCGPVRARDLSETALPYTPTRSDPITLEPSTAIIKIAANHAIHNKVGGFPFAADFDPFEDLS